MRKIMLAAVVIFAGQAVCAEATPRFLDLHRIQSEKKNVKAAGKKKFKRGRFDPGRLAGQAVRGGERCLSDHER